VLPAVELDRELQSGTGEIDNIAPDRLLPAEAVALTNFT